MAIFTGCTTVETTTKNADGSVTTTKTSKFDGEVFGTAVGAGAGALVTVRSPRNTQGFAK